MDKSSLKTMAFLVVIALILAGLATLAAPPKQSPAEQMLMTSGEAGKGWIRSLTHYPYADPGMESASRCVFSERNATGELVIQVTVEVFNSTTTCLSSYEYLNSSAYADRASDNYTPLSIGDRAVEYQVHADILFPNGTSFIYPIGIPLVYLARGDVLCIIQTEGGGLYGSPMAWWQAVALDFARIQLGDIDRYLAVNI